MQEIYNKRWNRFMSNINSLIKPEAEITEERNVGNEGADEQAMLQIAQLAFKRRQGFVRQSIEQEGKYKFLFASVDVVEKKRKKIEDQNQNLVVPNSSKTSESDR